MPKHEAVPLVNRTFVESFNKFRPPRSIGMRLIGDCMKKTILDLRATEETFEPPDMRGMMNMSWGSAYEVWILERFKQANLLKYGGILWKDMQVNIRVEESNGYMDGLGVWEGQDIAIEVKTKGSRDFDMIVAGKKPPDKSHIYQIMMYMHLLKLSKGWLVYIDREKNFEGRNGETTPRWDIIEVDYDSGLGSKLERRLIRLSRHKREGTVPDKEPKTANDERCRFCAHKESCWGKSGTDRKSRESPAAKRIANASRARRRAKLFTAEPEGSVGETVS
jgi:CRISPR/Cas system-associated exonuclease Cas4 (RecB family)